MKTTNYLSVRDTIEPGDIVLFGSSNIISRIIGNVSKSKWTHIELIDKMSGGRLICVGSNSDGVNPHFLSEKIKTHSDFCILRPIRTKKDKQLALNQVFSRAEQGVKYDFLGGLQELLFRKFGIKTKFSWSTTKRDICSEFIQTYTNCFDIYEYTSKPKHPIFPCDFINNRKPKNMMLLYEND